MGNLKIAYGGTLFFAAMAMTVALIWVSCICIERNRTKAPDLAPDYQQVEWFCWFCVAITLVLLGMGV